MLQAKSNDGKLVTIAAFPPEKIEYMRKHHQFFCPICHERVIIKAGRYVTPHFAHEYKSTCPSSERGEGPYHIRGKLILHRWLKYQNIPVQLESFLKNINQIPDLLLTINGKKIALEFQCARIPIETIQKRNKGYKRAGIIPIWILGKNLFKRTYKKLHVNPFKLQFIHKFNESTPTVLYYFCPKTLHFFLITNLYMSSHYRAFHTIKIKNLKTMTFKQLFSYDTMSDKQLFSLWKSEIQRFRLQQRYQSTGEELKWRTWLYNKRIAIDQLPLYVHLPTELQFIMKVPPWNWQSRLCLDIIHPLKIGETFTLSQCFQLLKSFIHPQNFYPLINDIMSPIEQYLSYLQHLRIVKRVGNNHYRKEKDIQFNRNIEETIKNDNVLINQLMYNYS